MVSQNYRYDKTLVRSALRYDFNEIAKKNRDKIFLRIHGLQKLGSTYMFVVGKTMFQGYFLDLSLTTSDFHGPDIGVNLIGKSIGYKTGHKKQ